MRLVSIVRSKIDISLYRFIYLCKEINSFDHCFQLIFLVPCFYNLVLHWN